MPYRKLPHSVKHWMVVEEEAATVEGKAAGEEGSGVEGLVS